MTWTISWPDGEPPDQQRRQSAALPVIAGHTWVAEVDSRGTRAGDRVLRLYVEGPRTAVRNRDGDALWLTDKGITPAPAEPMGDHDEILNDSDTGQEALAMLGLDDLFGWAGAVGCVPAARAEPITVSSDFGTLIVETDAATGVVRRVTSEPASGHGLEVVARWRLLPTDDGWFRS